MPAAGIVSVKLSPHDAAMIAVWLRNRPPSLWGVAKSNAPTLSNGIRTELVDHFDNFDRRKRSSGRFAPLTMEIDRQDAEWFALQVRRGMFATGRQASMPTPVRLFCLLCAAGVQKKRGANNLRGKDLADAIEHQAIRVADENATHDPRFMKRLRKRQRSETSARNAWADWQATALRRAPEENLP